MDAGVFLAKVKLLSSSSSIHKFINSPGVLGTAARLGRWLWGEGVVQVGLSSPKMLENISGSCSCWANTGPVSCIVTGLY